MAVRRDVALAAFQHTGSLVREILNIRKKPRKSNAASTKDDAKDLMK